jgi:L-ascorbate metabolism protein UlaG (beta-lactamase superfamily)
VTLKSDHFAGRHFFNPNGPALQPFTAVPRMLASRRTPWPRHVDLVVVTPPPPDPAGVVVTFIGHATFLIQTDTGNLLTDPVWAKCAGPWGVLGPRRVRATAMALKDVPPISVILLSHNHYDHCDLRTLSTLARRFEPIVVTPLGNARLLRSAGLRHVEELDWWQRATTTPMAITLTPAHHFSGRSLLDRNRALWGGFVIGVAGRRIYFAGDSAYAPIFRDIRDRLGPPDLSLLPIGAYEPRWFMRSVHMNPDEAVRAHLDLQSVQSIGMHFGTFQLTTEGIDEPLLKLEAARRARNIAESRFRTLEFGESMQIRDGKFNGSALRNEPV